MLCVMNTNEEYNLVPLCLFQRKILILIPFSTPPPLQKQPNKGIYSKYFTFCLSVVFPVEFYLWRNSANELTDNLLLGGGNMVLHGVLTFINDRKKCKIQPPSGTGID